MNQDEKQESQSSLPLKVTVLCFVCSKVIDTSGNFGQTDAGFVHEDCLELNLEGDLSHA